jgi:predicted membrane-bound spermidine synthase
MALALVLLPTMLMGGTLPLLVAHLVRRSGSVGRSVSMHYFVNTQGSAQASAAAVFLFLGHLGQKRTVALAGCINLTVSAAAWAQRDKSPHDAGK